MIRFRWSYESTEEEEQRALIDWARIMEWKHPDLRMLFHIPNGGLRNKTVGCKLKAAGVKSGVPDLFLLIPRGRFHGLAIELKAPRGRATREQLSWIANLRERGYCAEICMGWEKAKDVILKYLGMEMRRDAH